MSTHQGEGTKSTRRAAADLSDAQWHIVTENEANTGVELADTQGIICAGILEFEGDDGDLVTVIEHGPAKVMLGATFERLDYPFKTDNQGRAVPWTAGTAAVGFIKQLGVSGDIVECFVQKHGVSTAS